MQFTFGNVPPNAEGGFHYPQKLPSGDLHVLSAGTKEELVKSVSSFRIGMGMDIGMPDVDVTDYLCEKWPRFCVPDPGGEADESVENKTLRQRTTNWRANRYAQASKGGIALVSEDVANERTSICSTCPNNLPNRDSCPPCVAENDRVLFMLRNGRSSTTKVGGCGITGQDNMTAAFFLPEMLGYAKKYKDNLPEFCWMLPLI